MVVCPFFLRGNCKFGANCRNEHPRSNDSGGGFNRGGGSFNGGGGGNRFGALDSGFGGRTTSNPFGAPSQGGSSQPSARSHQKRFTEEDVSRDVLIRDLRNERPEWPLSSYAGSHQSPKDIIAGVEYSPEEARIAYYLARSEGREQAGQQAETELANQAQQQIQKVIADPDGAKRYVLAGKSEHPNRWDHADRWDPKEGRALTKREKEQGISSSSQQQPTSTPFGAPASSGFSAGSSAFGSTGFGQPSALGQKSNPFGAPSGPKATTQPAFGQSGFGQPSAPAQGSAFGQASALGQTSSLAQGSAFGKPSFGSATPFGQPAGGATTFGQPSAFATGAGQTSGSAFGQPAFGQQTAIGQQPSVFGAPSAFGGGGFGQTQQPQPAPSAFGQPQTQPSAFGQPQAQTKDDSMGDTTPATPAFTGFAQPTAPSQPNPFGVPSSSQQTPTAASPFGTLQPAAATSRPNPFGAPSQPQAAAASAPTQSAFTRPAQPSSGFASALQTNGTGPTHWNIRHILDNGAAPAPNPDTEAPREMYGNELGAYEKAYAVVKAEGHFESGVMPELPPLAEWVGWG